MVKIQKTEEGDITLPDTNEIDNKLELLKYTSEVQSRIKKDVSSDFILAKLNDQDKEGIIENTANAYFCKKITELIKQQAQTKQKNQWNKKTKQWEKTPHTNKYLQQITNHGNATFDAFMTRIYMTVILNRNVPQNHILGILSQQQIEEQEEEQPLELKSKIKQILKNEKEQPQQPQ